MNLVEMCFFCFFVEGIVGFFSGLFFGYNDFALGEDDSHFDVEVDTFFGAVLVE